MVQQDSIHLLNKAVADELQAVHQYMYFHFLLDDQGLKHLAGLFKRTAIQEMGHVELTAERILFLKGEIEMTPAGPVEKINEPEAILAKAMAMELDSAWSYNQAAVTCGAKSDAGTKQIFEHLVKDEESHFAQFELERDNIKRFGPSYLALQSLGAAEPGASPHGE
jgi:bacterioferritin